MGGKITEVLSTLVTKENEENSYDVVVNPGFGANITAKDFHAPGDDSPPHPGDLAVLVQVPGSEDYVVVGYIDQLNESVMSRGEKRLYSRDDKGVPIGELWLESDGTIRLNTGSDWAVQFTALATAYNELQQKHNDLMTEFVAHTHPTPAGASSPPTPINTQTPSTGDISKAKIEKVRL